MIRRHGWYLLLCFLTGCSTCPLADFCDFFKPGKMYPNQPNLTPYGGVGIPQGAIVPPLGPLGPGPVIPAPVPLPGNRPPAGFQLEPPLPPNPPPRPF